MSACRIVASPTNICSHRLLLVPLHDLGVAETRSGRISPGLAERAALAQKIPGLVETDLDRLEPAVLVLVEPALGPALVELVLLGDELLDAGVDLAVFHLEPPG